MFNLNKPQNTLLKRNKLITLVTFLVFLFGVTLFISSINSSDTLADTEERVFYEFYELEAVLDSSQEVPPVTTDATGSAKMTYNATIKTLVLDATVFGIDLENITGAHLHMGAKGVNGPIVLDLGATSDSDTSENFLKEIGYADFPAEYDSDLLAGDIYINVHSVSYPGGEVRGQLIVTELPPTPTLTPTPSSTLTPTPTPTLTPTPSSTLTPTPTPTLTPTPTPSPTPSPKPKKVIGSFKFPGRTTICTIEFWTVRRGFFFAMFPIISCS